MDLCRLPQRGCGQGIDAAGEVRDAEVDVPRILLLHPVRQRHALHDDEGNDAGHADDDGISPTAGQRAFELHFLNVVKSQVAAARLPRKRFFIEKGTFNASPSAHEFSV